MPSEPAGGILVAPVWLAWVSCSTGQAQRRHSTRVSERPLPIINAYYLLAVVVHN